MVSTASELVRRQCLRNEDGFIDENSCYVPFWYTKTGVIVKWCLFLGLVLFISLYLILGYLHAQRRIKKGLKPLTYHRFLVSRAQLARVDPAYRWPQAEAMPYHYNQQYYGMHNMPNMPPPPVYDPNAPRPPMYPGPPQGATKADPSQESAVPAAPPAGEYAPPPGPPPAGAMPNQNTGSNNPFRP